MSDTQRTIPAEAIRAVAEQIASDDGGNYDSGSDYDRQGYDDAAEAYIRAALPHLAQHVSPSVETLIPRWIEYRDRSARGEVPTGRAVEAFSTCIAELGAALSSTPTVEQVRRETREQVARDIEADRPKHADSCHCGGCTRLRKDARIARAAEAADR